MLLVAVFVALTACGTTPAVVKSLSASAGKTALAPNETTTIIASVSGDGDFEPGVAFSKVSGEGTVASTGSATATFTAGANAGTSVVRAAAIADLTKFVDLTFVVAPVGTLTVAISSPSADVSTKGTVPIQIAVAGGPDSVELLRDGELLVTLTAPYSYTWDTSAEPEKTYTLTARASKNGLTPVTSAPRKITVDRTGPKIASQLPAGGDANAYLADEISTTFDEPLAPSSVTTTSAKLLAGATPVTATVSLSQDGKKVTFVPSVMPTLPASLAMSFTAITDVLGNSATVTSAAFTAPEWPTMGPQPLDVNAAYNAVPWAISTDASGNTLIALDEYDDKQLTVNRNVYVKKWSGSAWTQLGGALDVTVGVDASNPSMVLDGSGNPIVAWNEGASISANQLYVKKWNGSAWTQLGAALNVNTGFNATSASIAIDGSGNPFVAWSEYDSVTYNTDVYVKKWNGSAWVLVGAGPIDLVTSEDSNAPSLKVDVNGLPVVAFREHDGTSGNVVVVRWSGSAWNLLGGPVDANFGDTAESASLALEANGTPVVAWEEASNIRVARWSGSAWTAIGGALDIDLPKLASSPDLRLTAANVPVVTWAENDGISLNVWVKVWTGSTWSPLGSTPLDVFQGKHASVSKLAFDPTGDPLVCFAESDGTSVNAYVKRWNHLP